MVESKIAKELKVSITPVRKAFTILEGEGLLTVFPYKGTYVTIITQEYINELKFVREYIEIAAIELSFDNLEDGDADYLTDISRESDKNFQQKNLFEAINYDILFHTFFFNKSNSALLIDIWDILKYRIQFYQSYAKMKPSPNGYMVFRHGDIINAVKNRDKNVLKLAMLDHIKTSGLDVNFPKSSEIQYK